ncbi:YT521-B-like domain-containing protein [Mycena alexandri]|uniref:YT521-B-like domain-containing protein n=1 Tax=Mycena alexandri TaxID=1745969 RepID=A0AAD6SMM4_9AGAR|nr:YT521-B-like domain-containing protein [Mycena alexandri]
MAEPPYELALSLTPKPSSHLQLHESVVYEQQFTPPPSPGPTEFASPSLKARAGDGYMPGRGGQNDRVSNTSGGRRQGQAQRERDRERRQQQSQPGYPSLNAPPPDLALSLDTQGYHHPLYATASHGHGHHQYPVHGGHRPLPAGGYPGHYMVSPQPPLNMAHTPPGAFAYSPFVPQLGAGQGQLGQQQEGQPQSIHAGYPTLASYPYAAHGADGSPPYTNSPGGQPSATTQQQQPSPVYPPGAAFRYPSPMPMSPSYAPYSPASFSPQPHYQMQQLQHHQVQHHPQHPPHQHGHHVYPGNVGAHGYAQYAHPSPGGHAQEGVEGGGTWWYVPSQAPQGQQQYDTPGQGQGGVSAYPFYHGAPQLDGVGGQHDGGGAYPSSPTYGGGPSTPTSSISGSHSQTHSAGGGASTASGLGAGGAGGGSHGAGRPPTGREKPLTRRSYHPNPPAHRSEWVMWAGNVPSDAGHDELWRFFTAVDAGAGAGPSGSASASESALGVTVDAGAAPPHPHPQPQLNPSGVLSIFLISRSSCAFVNYLSAPHLAAAIARFNGVPLRPLDPRCPRLVCRVRRKDDDLRAGVGGQRGMGMHRGWVRDKLGKGREEGGSGGDASSSETDTDLSALSLGSASPLEDSSSELHPHAARRPPPRPLGSTSSSGASGSGASTNSSLLRTYFPQRFFILKSLTRDDLDLSVRTGLWATQKHNEGILDRAFRTSKDVFLVFSVNKSGEFYGMAGPVGQNDVGRVNWTRRDSTASNAPGSPTAVRSQPLLTHGAGTRPPPVQQPLLSAEHLVTDSPAPFPSAGPPDVQSAPAELGRQHSNISVMSDWPMAKHGSLDQYARSVRQPQKREVIELDEAAPFRAMRGSPDVAAEAAAAAVAAAQAQTHERTGSAGSGLGLGPVAEEREDVTSTSPAPPAGAGREEGWGEDFRLHWLCTERLPFVRTRHIRNPWNHDREIKVSRDGTELEPGVGQALLEEWRTFLAQEAAEQETPMSESGRGTGTSRAARVAAGGGGGAGGSSRS